MRNILLKTSLKQENLERKRPAPRQPQQMKIKKSRSTEISRCRRT